MATETNNLPAGRQDQNLMAALTYFLGFITGVIFLLIEKNNMYIRFHAMQSILTFGGIFIVQMVLGAVPVLGLPISSLLSIASVILWIFLMVKAYQGEKYKLPYIGDFAETQVGKLDKK